MLKQLNATILKEDVFHFRKIRWIHFCILHYYMRWHVSTGHLCGYLTMKKYMMHAKGTIFFNMSHSLLEADL